MVILIVYLQITALFVSTRSHFITEIVKSLTAGSNECVVVVCTPQDMYASGCAVARAYTRKTVGEPPSAQPRPVREGQVKVEFLLVDGETDPAIPANLTESDMKVLESSCEAIQLTARLVDTPCNEMNTSAFVEEAVKVASDLGIVPTIIRGEELRERGFGGLYGVGKASVHPPALVVLSHKPPTSTKSIAWVGKGIVYDTGGLSIKGKTAMPGMKRDCGGAAAVLGAFSVAYVMPDREQCWTTSYQAR